MIRLALGVSFIVGALASCSRSPSTPDVPVAASPQAPASAPMTPALAPAEPDAAPTSDLVTELAVAAAADDAHASPTPETVVSAVDAAPPPGAVPAAPAAPDAGSTPEPARTVPPTGVYSSAEDAVLVYLEGTRTRDPERLWSVMTEAARAVLDNVIVRARAAPAEDLAKIGLSPDEVAHMAPRAFFDRMVRHAPEPDSDAPVSELMSTVDGETSAKVTFRLGKASCIADAVKDAEGWKVQVSRCTERP